MMTSTMMLRAARTALTRTVGSAGVGGRGVGAVGGCGCGGGRRPAGELGGGRLSCGAKRSFGYHRYAVSVKWAFDFEDAEEWLETQDIGALQQRLEADGYVQVDGLLTEREVELYRELYEAFVSGRIDGSRHRHDLGSHIPAQTQDNENVTQIMWPSDYVEHLAKGALHARTALLARRLVGDEMTFDFDMLIAKAPHTNTDVPWHQDEAYWPDLPDPRALSFWTAMDDATQDNGCMWFFPHSHEQSVLEHVPAVEGHHVLRAAEPIDEASAVCVPIHAGSCTVHYGNTLHRTQGNRTADWRRAYILNYRPWAMVQFMRQRGFDHGRSGLHALEQEAF